MANDIEINNKVIGENTKITLTVKMAIWIIGAVITLFSTAFTIAYFDVKKDVKDYKSIIDKEQKEFVKSVETNFEDKVEEKFKDIQEIKINVGIILDRTSNLRIPVYNPSNIPASTPANNVPPS